MSGFESYWLANDKRGHLAVMDSDKGGAIITKAPIIFGGLAEDEGVLDALRDLWVNHLAPNEAVTRNDILMDGPDCEYLVAFRNGFPPEQVLGNHPWCATNGENVIRVSNLGVELVDELLSDDHYVGSVNIDGHDWDTVLLREEFPFVHRYCHSGSENSGEYKRTTPADVSPLCIDQLDNMIAHKVPVLPCVFADTETIDLLRFVDAAEMMAPSPTQRPLPRGRSVSRRWWQFRK